MQLTMCKLLKQVNYFQTTNLKYQGVFPIPLKMKVIVENLPSDANKKEVFKHFHKFRQSIR